MSSSVVDEIKEKLNIVDFLRGYLTLQPAGKNFKALCPFHHEKTPSFMIFPDRQSWHCFGCSLGGDVFSFVEKYENVEFGEALRILADKAGVDVRKTNPAEYRYFQVLYNLNEEAKKFFKNQLKEPANKKAWDYLISRGLTPETIAEFEIGFAPPGFESLTINLNKFKYSIEDIIRSGLSFKTERGMVMDRFRNRIMFPLQNNFGKTIGFTGRLLPEFDDGKTGKYVNSPETPIYSKSKFLYGLYKSKSFIREEGAIIMEGQMDYLMSWQAGIKNCVATSGTALTSDHLSLLSRLTDKLIFSFDNDEAGFAALERAIDLAANQDFSIKVLNFPKELKDPAELAQKDPDKLKSVIKLAEPAMEFYFRRYLPQGKEFEIGEKKKRVRAVLSKIKKISSPIEREYWLKEFSKRAGIEIKTLTDEMEKLVVSESPVAADVLNTPPQENKKISHWDLISNRLLALLQAGGDWRKGEDIYTFLPVRHQKALEILKSGQHKSDDPSVDLIIEQAFLLPEQPEDLEKELADLKKQLVKTYFIERKNIVKEKIRNAEVSGKVKELESAVSEFDALVKEEVKFNRH
ncbi:MAG: DNA primase [Patescibacteria group bacterium]|nr:DNA primase [Patescibacteria group bacterium]